MNTEIVHLSAPSPCPRASSEVALKDILARVRTDAEFDASDAMHRLFDEQMPHTHWSEISEWADNALEKAGIDAPYGDALHAIVHATIAHSYYSGIAAVARTLQVDAEELHYACSESLDPDCKTPPVGINGLRDKLSETRAWLNDIRRPRSTPNGP